MLIGETGGRDEQEAAEYPASIDYQEPVVAYVAGRYAQAERCMGHAGTADLFG